MLQSLSKITELMRVEKYEPVENHNVKIIGYIHAGGTVAYEKLCAAIEGLKYEASYTEMIVLVPADRQPRDGKCEIVCSCFVHVCVVCVCGGGVGCLQFHFKIPVHLVSASIKAACCLYW